MGRLAGCSLGRSCRTGVGIRTDPDRSHVRVPARRRGRASGGHASRRGAMLRPRARGGTGRRTTPDLLAILEFDVGRRLRGRAPCRRGCGCTRQRFDSGRGPYRWACVTGSWSRPAAQEAPQDVERSFGECTHFDPHEVPDQSPLPMIETTGESVRRADREKARAPDTARVPD